MNIRIQSTGEVVSEQGFRALHPNTSLPQQLTEATINDLGADVVFEGPQATGGEFWQYSVYGGVEQKNGKWYTKYVLGPTFSDTEERDAYVSNAKTEIVNSKVTTIKSERDRRIQICGYKVGNNWYHSDTFSRTQQMGLVMLGANIPAGTKWKTMDGSFVTMTQTLAGQIFAAAVAKDIATFAAAETHIAAVKASDTPNSYDFSQGWPEVYTA
jgi:hypothetical protein